MKNAGKCRNIISYYFSSCTDNICNTCPPFSYISGKEIPEVVRYLGRVLTPAVIGMLVIYCLKGTTLSELPYGIPEGLAVLVTAGLHIWKRNNLLSIGAGTVLYMFLIQVVF